MKILLVTDAWLPQTHAAVYTLLELVRQLQADGHEAVVMHPGQFRHLRAPSWLGMDVAGWPGPGVRRAIEAHAPDAIHIATEGPLGWAARSACDALGLPFTSSCLLRLPQRLRERAAVPTAWTQAALRRFHRPSARVLVSSQPLLEHLQAHGLRQAAPWTPGVDTRLFAPAPASVAQAILGPLAHPVSLYVGPIAHERHIEDFLRLDVPGSKLVCGAGPQQRALRHRFPNVHWLGYLPRTELARVYAAADVVVHPARSTHPAPVVLEALACGTPVAAYPVDGLLHFIGQSGAAALHSDLREAWHEALRIRREHARGFAMRYAWPRAGERFVASLCPVPRTVASGGQRVALRAPHSVESARLRAIH